ncbi:MAG TPA: UPF0280 family protein [Syntrophomonadaceae bacterium]|nr:UPF0280 family protein [Syntrophomonadaceae bacterium]
MEYIERTYRKRVNGEGMVSFPVSLRESDLYISVDEASYTPELERFSLSLLYKCRGVLEQYLVRDPDFGRSLKPCSVSRHSPRIVRMMAAAAARAEVGPMAAVAGTIAEIVGRGLLRCAREVIVENGGDIFLTTLRPVTVGIFAGPSPLSERVGIRVYPGQGIRGICTSSGTVGPSLSFGRADAAVVLSTNAALADAAATALGNRVHTQSDISPALNYICGIRGVRGALVIQGDRLGVMGDVELVPLHR